jgi:hypothetical protein
VSLGDKRMMTNINFTILLIAFSLCWSIEDFKYQNGKVLKGCVIEKGIYDITLVHSIPKLAWQRDFKNRIRVLPKNPLTSTHFEVIPRNSSINAFILKSHDRFLTQRITVWYDKDGSKATKSTTFLTMDESIAAPIKAFCDEKQGAKGGYYLQVGEHKWMEYRIHHNDVHILRTDDPKSKWQFKFS